MKHEKHYDQIKTFIQHLTQDTQHNTVAVIVHKNEGDLFKHLCIFFSFFLEEATLVRNNFNLFLK